jgi:ketosteroid isomerase-like protein
MTRHPIEHLIAKADKAIVSEDFDTLMDIYSDDAVLVIEPRRTAKGKENILKAFQIIAVYFKNGLQVKQNGLEILESNDTALVLANTALPAPNLSTIERKATYVFNRSPNGQWLCSIDNSYGHEIINFRDNNKTL